MNQKQSNQEWQQLQNHITGFFGKALSNDVPKIEYKPLFTVKLLEMPSEYHQNNLQKMSV